jgi:hypothetical protein
MERGNLWEMKWSLSIPGEGRATPLLSIPREGIVKA